MGLDADTTTTTPLNNSLSQSNQHDPSLNDKSSKRHGPKRKPKPKPASSTGDNVATAPPEGSAANDATNKKRRGSRRTRGGPKHEEGQNDSPKDTVNKKRQRPSKKTTGSTTPAASSSTTVDSTLNNHSSQQQQQQQQSDSVSKETPSNKKKSRRTKAQKASSPESTAPLNLAKHRAQAKLTTTQDDIDENHVQDNVKKGSSSRRSKRSGKKKASVATAAVDDLASGLAQDLRTSTYECMVCWDVVRAGHQTWTCDCCWAVFHLSCIKKWATRSLQEKETNKPVTSWRCPGCQFTRTAIPKDYICFCGKQRNPEPNRYLTPHSCGQLCKKSRQCPHPCVLPCHPGPCPPCTAMTPMMSCFCGNHSRQLRCVEADYSVRGYQCEDSCGELLGCEKHVCQEKCHPGLCPPCPLEEIQKCYCGKDEQTMPCGSGVGVTSGDHVGYHACKATCNRPFTCGIHHCQKTCHPQDVESNTCPFDPSIVKTCPCGATAIDSLLHGTSRTSCSDDIPTCNEICDKKLPCGHNCKQSCHAGNCAPCQETVNVPCRCRSTTFTATCANVCEAAGGESPLCDKVCRASKHCGRHQCGAVCCPAAKTKGSKKTSIRDHVHECPEICGRTLSCGNHTCQARCHKGKCQPCLEAVFDEVTCHCGHTRLDPPVRCGTTLPPCPHPCTRPSPCGHVRLLQHNCHPDSETCPPCAMLVTRTCVCGKTELKNVPCYRGSPRCGRICDKPLSCGRHLCNKSCHGGACLADEQVCTQICNGKRSCGHGCSSRCHGSEPCPEQEPCQTMVRVACKCGQNALQVPCNATATSTGSKRELDCNDFCAKVERNRKLAMALEIDPEKAEEPAPSIDELGYFDDPLCEFYLENRSWCKQMETTLIDFAKGSKQVLHFKPMKSNFRRFIHRYSVHFNLGTEAVDPEPYRSVVVRKSLGQARIPSPLLSVAAHHPSMNRPPAPMPETNGLKSKHQQPVNALCLSDLAFGLVETELDLELAKAFEDIKYKSQWQTESDSVLVFPILDDKLALDEKEAMVWQLKKAVKDVVVSSGKAARVDCCWVDRLGKITWTERKGILEQEQASEQQQQQQQQQSTNVFDVLASGTDETLDVVPSSDDKDAWDQEEPITKVSTTPLSEDKSPSEVEAK
ncbi:hypothetical protein K492DRAFT_132456 [Lichtheimia hyalospora FSU 10163]|nr:hypothetical protein K492DRAFT_132456 [Lichtheimia hyalospora FSU 10163]